MANNIFNRLQFARGLNPDSSNGVFATREDAYNYVIYHQALGDYPSITDPEKNRPSLAGEPLVLLYESNSATKGPNVVLAIGSVGNGTKSPSNRTYFIDTQKTEEEIEELNIRIEDLAKLINVVTVDSSTIDFTCEKTAEGTVISGDVKLADYRILSGKVNENIIQIESNEGLYAFVDMDYDPETFVITLNVNGVTKGFQLPPDQHVVKGWYDPEEESIFFKLADGSKIKVLVTKLIEEWTVLPDGQTINGYKVSGQTVHYTPIVFSKTHVGADETEHEGIYDWQDVLEADIRVADHIGDNILHKDRTGRYLYVKGTADNIKYKEGMTVMDALEKADTKISTSIGNLIYKRPDGIYAAAMLDYNTAENKLKYTYSDGNSGELKEIEFKLNSVKLLEDITYDPTKEVIVIRYIDAQGEYQRVEIPASDIIEEWIVNNEAHNIKLNKYRSEGAGKDVLSADAKIHNGDNNILEDLNHELYVNGISDNIKYNITGDTTVKEVLDNLSASTVILDIKIDKEIDDRITDVNEEEARAKAAENELNVLINQEREDRIVDVNEEQERAEAAENELNVLINQEREDRIADVNDEEARAKAEEGKLVDTIGSGFTTDIHETVTYKFNELSDRVNEESEKLQNEIIRSTEKDIQHDNRLDSIDGEIGDGFNPRNTVRDEIDALKGKIESVSADSATKLVDIVNIDHSIDVDKTEPTVPVVKVNLSGEIEDNKPNIIKLNADGLYAGVDLIYEFNEEVGTNQLIFKTTNGTKVYDLKTNSVVDKIYYDPNRESIIIEYTVNGHRMPDVVIPVGDLINEWRVWDGHEGAVQLEKERIASGTTEQDVLKASVVISEIHDDNLIVNDNGALYVPGQGIIDNANAIQSLDTRLTTAESDIDILVNGLANETTRATNRENNLEQLISSEAESRINGDSVLSEKIQTETSRATLKENELQSAISNEIDRATAREGELNTAIVNETLRAQAADNELYQKIADETADRATADAALDSKISQEISRAQVSENTIYERLESEIARSTGEDNRLSAAIEAETDAREIADDELAEEIRKSRLTFEDTSSIDFNNPYVENNVVKADVKLQGGDNIIKLGSGLYATASLEYEPTGNKIRLVTSNGAQEYIDLVGATLLDSIVYDPVNKVLKIIYTDGTGSQRETSVGVTDLWNEWIVQNPSEKSAVELTKIIGDPGNPDTLRGRVLITDDRNGDGKPDEGSDNLIEIKNNGLYVDGSKINKASEDVDCIEKELGVFEKVVLGHKIGEECGEGYTYQPYAGACIISGATSFNEADQMLNDKICELLSMWQSGETCTSEADWKVDGLYRKVQVDVKLSHGNNASMTDDDLTTHDLSGSYIDPTNSEFTDTNALRIVCLSEGPSGITPTVSTKQNGIYLSNVWDCGLYYGPSDTEAKEAAENAGYKTNYYTDEDETACNYNYMNNVRQTDPLG